MGAFQLPDSVDGAAFGCLIYSALCLAGNVVLLWLIWVHREGTSYVAFISYFTLLATVSSLVQQLYDYILWVDIRTWQFWYGRDNYNDAEVQYQNEIFGLKLALSYVRIACFMIEASLVFFFSLALAATVYGWWAKKAQFQRNLSIVGRILPIILAIITILLLQLEISHRNFMVYLVIANAQFLISLFGSCIFLLMILFKYLQTRRRLHTWLTLEYGQNSKAASATTASTGMGSKRSRAHSGPRPSATFDNWLVIRLTIAFMALCVFAWTNLSPRFRNRTKILATLDETGPDLSHARAMGTVTGYLSGVSPSLLAFLVFGTTKAFQRKMARTFLPAFLRRKPHDDLTSFEYQLPYSSNATSSYARASTGFPAPSVTPQDHHNRSSSLIRRPETAVSTPRTPKTSRTLGTTAVRMGHYQSPEPTLRTATKETLVPAPLLPPATKALNSIREARNEYGWLDDASAHANLRHSRIGVAISPRMPAGDAVSPWPEPLHPAKAAAASGRSTAAPSRRGPTFFHDSDSDSIASMGKGKVPPAAPLPPPLSIPISRFNSKPQHGTPGGGGHKRRPSDTGSITRIWSDGRRDRGKPVPTAANSTRPGSSRRARGGSESESPGQGPRAGSGHSRHVTPIRRGSAV
ncbi:unnamed protein product [Discula destructiva]